MTQRAAVLARTILTVAVGAAFLAGCSGYGYHRHSDGRYYPPGPRSTSGPSSPPSPLPPPPQPRL